jgi:hypothetical protein
MIGAAAGNASSYVRPQIDHALVDEGKHRAFGKDTGTAEQAAHLDRSEGDEQFADVVGCQDGTLGRQ